MERDSAFSANATAAKLREASIGELLSELLFPVEAWFTGRETAVFMEIVRRAQGGREAPQAERTPR